MRGFRIGRVFGIDVRVAWSWVFIFVLLTWNLVAVFLHWHRDWSPLEALVTASAASLAFFGCILLHELAHSVVAMHYGIRVRSITLFLFGGVSNIENQPPSARAEFLMAIAGPITSIVLGIGFWVLASLVTSVSMANADDALHLVSGLGPLGTLLVWLGPINVVIGFFNLIPGFPLDGGRVLRAALWKISGDGSAATRQAAYVGQAIGWLFIAAGIAMTFGVRLPFFGTGFIGGLWLAFIGWFLHSAAIQEGSRVALDDALAGMTVEQLMQRRGPVVAPEMSVATLVHEHLIPGDDRGLPVVRDGKLMGLVSIADVRTLRPEQWAGTPVETIMRGAAGLSIASPQDPLAKAFAELAHRDVDQLPVVVDGELVGMLRRRDVTRWLELAWKPTVRGTSTESGAGRHDEGEGAHPVTHRPRHA
jgi:Zn-dependent protease/CBS domain-containing protein